MADSDASIKSYLVVKVLEASGHNSNEIKVWDDDFKEGYVRVEIRGGARTVRKQTAVHRVRDNLIAWEEQLLLEVLEGASELRIMLCRQKQGGESRASIVAACGIYVRDIHEAQPIDKYFELYKPGTGAEGGFIRVSMNELDPDQVRSGNGLLAEAEAGQKKKTKKRGGFPVLPLGILAAGAAIAIGLLRKH